MKTPAHIRRVKDQTGAGKGDFVTARETDYYG